MPDTGSTLPVLYVRQLVEQVRRSRVDVTRWLTSCRLPEAKLDDPALTISYPLFERLVVEALELTNEPALGLLVGGRLPPSTHGILGYAAMNAGTIRQAVDLLARFVRLRLSLISITHEVQRRDARVLFRATPRAIELERPLLEAVMLTIKNSLDAITMGAVPVRLVTFPFATPGYAPLARELFGCPVRWGERRASLVLPAELIDEPLALADPDAFAEATRICQRELDKLAENESLATRVQRVLLEKQNGFPSLPVTARLFHMTPRTLHRRLLDEGTSFRRVLEDVRHTLAVAHLKSERFGIEEIAYTLGYSDLANFRRAFKRWESMAPSEYRARCAPPAPKRR